MRYLYSFGLILLLAISAAGQTISSTISGIVTDPTGALLPNVHVTLKEAGTGLTQTANTNSAGLFSFPNINPGTYDLTFEDRGFKQRIEQNVQLNSSETRDLGKIALQVGSVTESVVVTAEVTPVQTTTGEKSATIDGNQLNTVEVKGRDLFAYTKLVPGVVDTNNSRDATDPGNIAGITINGNTSAKNFTVDGVTDVDTGSNGTIHYEPNLDAISEVRVLTAGYQAEYGRNSGGTISVTTKSGTRDFHGSAWWNHRHEEFNANSYFNKQQNKPRDRYRYNVLGWSFGGPIYIPGHFNTSKTKFFFFGSQEYTKRFVPVTSFSRIMPTAAEKAGDFSNSRDQNGNLIKLTSPSTLAVPLPAGCSSTVAGRSCIIPLADLDPNGQAMLNWLPTGVPGSVAGLPTANYFVQASASHPRRNDVLRGDVYATSKLRGYFRWVNDFDDLTSLFQAGIPWADRGVLDHPNPGHGYGAGATYTFSPTLVNEFTWGKDWNTWSWYPVNPSTVAASNVAATINGQSVNPPLLFAPPTSPAGLNGYDPVIPGMVYGSNLIAGGTACTGSSCVPSITRGGTWDYFNSNTIYSYQDNVTKVKGRHTMKFGIYLEQNQKLQPSGTNYAGTYDFSDNAAGFTNNTGYTFANAITGNFNQFNQTTNRQTFNVHYWNLEFFGQDNWRITSKLSLDYGLRMYHQSPQVDQAHTFAYFDPATFSASQVPQQYYPTKVGGVRVGCAASAPITSGVGCPSGQTSNAAAIGLYVPGSGTPGNGMHQVGVGGNPAASYSTAPLVPAPRVGFAYDVFGNGRTAIRGSYGLFYNRVDGNQVYNMSGQPPITFTPAVFNSTIATIRSGAAGSGLFGPTNINTWTGRTPWDRVHNGNFGIQQAIGNSMVLDVAWVGNYGKNQALRYNINPIPLATTFNSASIDPTTNAVYSTNILRTMYGKYAGIGTIGAENFLGHTNYNSLQASINRRLWKGLQFGVAYTWSRSLGTTAYDPMLTPAQNEKRNYGPNSNDRPQNLQVNYTYNLPNAGKALNNKFVGAFTDNWALSGVYSLTSGAPVTINTNISGNNLLAVTGSPDATLRADVVGNAKAVPAASTGCTIVYCAPFAFNPNAFVAPTTPVNGTIDLGNESNNYVRLPRYDNLDLSLQKRIPLHMGEGRGLSLRVQAFNALNHTQFTGAGTQGNLGTFGSAFTNLTGTSAFGRLNAAAPARIMSFETRFQF